MAFKLAFTGTQKGMTPYQLETVKQILTETPPDTLIHGGCIGADCEVDNIAWELGIHREIFPSTIVSKRGMCNLLGKLFVHDAMDPLKRNRFMVNRADGVIACPRQEQEIVRSGTWATIRYARKKLGANGVVVIRP